MTGSTTSGDQPYSRIALPTSRASVDVGEHAGLERRGRQVLGQRGELRGDHGLGHRLHRVDAASILRGEGDDDRGAEHAELLEGLEVGLDAGAAAGVRSRDRQRDLHGTSMAMTSPLRTMIRDLHRRRGRERRGLALAEGVRLVEEALAAELPLRGAAISPALEATTRGRALKSALERRGRADRAHERERARRARRHGAPPGCGGRGGAAPLDDGGHPGGARVGRSSCSTAYRIPATSAPSCARRSVSVRREWSR